MLVATPSPNDVQEQMPWTVALAHQPEDRDDGAPRTAWRRPSAQIDPAVGLGWHAGLVARTRSFVVFAAYDSTTEVRLLGDDIV